MLRVDCLNKLRGRKSLTSPAKGLRTGVVAALVLIAHTVSLPAEVLSPDYLRGIRPILVTNCFPCHGPDSRSRQAGLRFDQPAAALSRLESGAVAIVPGLAGQSEMIRRIESTEADSLMPPPDSLKYLTDAEKQLLRQWVDAGAQFEEHWAYRAPQRPVVPQVSRPEWPRNAVDAFVLSRLDVEGLASSPEADPETLLRRVSLDLTGLPPTVNELETFLADKSGDGYERAVDRLLESPHLGEKLTQDWLDLARFGDTSGYQDDNDRPNFPYRDAVIHAFNSNMPFDQFTIESLAGDLLPHPTTSQKVLSGFNRLHRYNEEGGSDPEEFRMVYAADRTNTTAATWMGLTFVCAQCHDHKYEPISQREYYQVLAFFNSLKGEITVSKGPANPPQIRVPSLEDQQRIEELHLAVDQLESILQTRDAETTRAFNKWIEQASASMKLTQTDPLSTTKSPDGFSVAQLLATPANQRTDVQTAQLRQHYIREFAPEMLELLTQVNSLRKEIENLIQSAPLALIWEETETPRPTQILTRGDYQQPGEVVERAVPSIFPSLATDVPRDRLALARWLVSGEHPLTARVVVNRYWKQVFGAGLVRTPDDFGMRGELPTHPELLDWLAVEFQTAGPNQTAWDVKRLLRLLVTSATYRQSSKVSRMLRDRDPDNLLVARNTRFRLSAEEIRDAALVASGLLNRTIGGRSVYPYQPDHFYRDKEDDPNEWKWPVETGPDLYRRGLYIFIRRTSPYPSFQTFDVSGRGECTVARARTNTPLQALVTLNDPVFIEAARVLAERGLQESGPHWKDRLRFLYRCVFTRSPTESEQAVLERLYQAEWKRYTDDPQAAASVSRQGRAVPAVSLDPVEVAAWTTVANALLNLDEAITRE